MPMKKIKSFVCFEMLEEGYLKTISFINMYKIFCLHPLL
jgi:hypothetical protein